MTNINLSKIVNVTTLEEETNERFKFEKIIGRGSYSVVFSAFDKQTKQYVAVKKVSNIFDTIKNTRRVLREIKIQHKMNHENVTKVIDAIIPHTEGYKQYNSIYIVLDLMDTDLHNVIYSDQYLSIDHRRYFMYQMLCAMKYVHSSNVLHRDLKPCNILVNGNCDLQICDFGCARVLNENNIDEVDFTSEYVTTRWYRAPEVLLSSSQYGKEIDMWSLGCIFAELILRQPIFQGKSTLNQLSVINEIIGSPTDNDLLYIDNDNARKFMNSLQKLPTVNWKKL